MYHLCTFSCTLLLVGLMSIESYALGMQYLQWLGLPPLFVSHYIPHFPHTRS